MGKESPGIFDIRGNAPTFSGAKKYSDRLQRISILPVVPESRVIRGRKGAIKGKSERGIRVN
jgi:hypothetical protein